MTNEKGASLIRVGALSTNTSILPTNGTNVSDKFTHDQSNEDY